MADENKPAFYPRVGNIKAKNFRSAQPAPFINDPRAMDLPQYGDIDLSQPTKANLEMGRRMAERDAQLKRQQSADTSPLEKAAGALQAVRLMGSALTQSINSLPTRIAKGDEAADKFMQERMYKPEQPLAYEYAGDLGNMLERLETEYKIPPVLPEAMALQYLAGPATSQATRGALQAGMALERGMEPVVRGALERGGLPREMALAMGANTQSNVVKPYGGNWLSGEDQLTIPERDLRRLKVDTMMGGQGDTVESLISKKDAINKWIDSNLKNYVKKEMATPDDPVRKLAEQGIIHMPLREELDRVGYLEDIRKAEGYPVEGMGKSELAKRWENIADDSIRVTKAGAIQDQANTGAKLEKARAELEAHKKQIDEDFIALLKDKGGLSDKDRATFDKFPNFQKAEILGDTKYKELQGNINSLLGRESGFEKRAGDLNPFVAKLDPETRLYSGGLYNLGFDHIIDVLKEDLAAGRIRPEQLNKVSMEQAVRRTYEYDQELAAKMNAARQTAREGLPVHKEYPEGYKWIQLNRPGDFAAESNAMGHSARGYEPPKNHPDWIEGSGDEGHLGYGYGGWEGIKSGRAKVYSLVDAKGEPHVTIETKAPDMRSNYDELQPLQRQADLEADAQNFQTFAERDKFVDQRYQELKAQMMAQKKPEGDYAIMQIKGKGNAKPKEDYLPFVQDFVRGGNWSDVRDFQNTGLAKLQEDSDLAKWLQEKQIQLPKYPTKKELDNYEADFLLEKLGQKDFDDLGMGFLKGDEGMKRGGKVSISNNPDTMMLELGNKRMKEGGAEDDTKPYFGGAGTKKYAAAKKRAEDADVNLLKDPKTYAAVASFMGEAPDQLGFSVMHPDYQGVREVADPAFYAGTALGVAPLGKALNAPFAAVGKALDPAVGRFVTKTMERGGLGADILTDMGRGTRSYAHLPHTEKSPDPTVGTRYKRTDIGGLVPRKDLDIEKLDKSSVKVFPWDASDRNKLVTEVSDIPLTNPVLLEGGDNYMRDIKHVKKRIAGASNEGIANRIQDRINQASVENQILGGTGKVFGFPIRMGDKAEHASTFPTDIAMDLLKQGNLSRKELDDLTNELRGMSFEAKGKGYFQNVAPIDSPEFLIQLREGLKGDKEKGITSVTDMNLRRALMDRLSQKKYQKRLEYNYPDLIGSVIADELKGVPKGWVGNVSAELDPFTNIRPSKSSTYSHDFGGKYYASMPNMPVEFLMPNTFEGIYLEMKALYPNAKPEALRNMTIGAMEKRKDKISEMIGPRSIDAVKLYQEGLKQGEFDPNDIKQIYDYMRRKKFNLKLENVKKAEGGAVTGDDLIIEERPL